MAILTEFVFRLSFGLAAAMAITPASKVTSGFYRNHLYVLLGLSTLLAAVALAAPSQLEVWPPVVLAALCYVGSVAWLYEKPRLGRALLILIATVALLGAYLTTPACIPGAIRRAGVWMIEPTECVIPADTSMASPAATPNRAAEAANILRWFDPLTSGLVLGSTIAAMFLGHWYLNSPTMEIAPLKRLVMLMVGSVLLRALVCGAGLALWISSDASPSAGQYSLLALRWLSGIVGALVTAGMTWQTLKIPNTQSATGILYVALLLVFLGELTSQLLSAGSVYPL